LTVEIGGERVLGAGLQAANGDRSGATGVLALDFGRADPHAEQPGRQGALRQLDS